MHAGHGLTFNTVAAVARMPEIVELNIGHFLIGEAIFGGLRAGHPPHARADGRGARRRDRGQRERRGAMILGIGNDIIDIRRIEKTLERYGERFLDACLHRHRAREIGRPRRPRRLLRQALRRQGGLRQGAGHRVAQGVFWRDMGVVNLPRAGRPWC